MFVHLQHGALPFPLDLLYLLLVGCTLLKSAFFAICSEGEEPIELPLSLGQPVVLDDVSVALAGLGDVGEDGG